MLLITEEGKIRPNALQGERRKPCILPPLLQSEDRLGVVYRVEEWSLVQNSIDMAGHGSLRDVGEVLQLPCFLGRDFWWDEQAESVRWDVVHLEGIFIGVLSIGDVCWVKKAKKCKSSAASYHTIAKVCGLCR